MFEPKIVTVPDGEVVTRHLEANLIETRYKGKCPVSLVEAVRDQTPSLLQAVPGASWLLDMSEVSSADPGGRVPGRAILSKFRELGGDKFAVVLSNARLRFLLSAVAFAIGLDMKFFVSRDEALAYLRTKKN